MAKSKSPTAKKTKTRIQRKTEYNKTVKKSKPKQKSPDQLKLLLNPEDTPQNPLTWERLMDWLANTGWVEGFIRKKISPMDAHLIEDYTQSIWVAILTIKKERMMEIWYHGKGAFVNYLKTVMGIQLKSVCCEAYKTNKHFHHTHISLSEDQWYNLEEGNTTTYYEQAYPVKYQCPSGNYKKNIIVEYDTHEIHADYNDLTYNQIHSELLYEQSTKEEMDENETTRSDHARSEDSNTELQESSLSDDDIPR